MKAFLLNNVVRRTGVPILAISCYILITLIATGCVSAPPQVVLLHDKEGEMLKNLRRTHLAMVDAYVDKKIEIFDAFYFKEYVVKYRQRWEAAFAARMGRPYDPDRDFSTFSNDLVASYLKNVEPLNKLRADLREQITAVHDQVAQAHQTVGAWIHSVEKLNTAQRETANKLLGSINANLSVEKMETRIDEVTTSLINKLK